MEKLPIWVKLVAAILLAAILIGASRILLYLDKLPS
jgi:hypothetical protein